MPTKTKGQIVSRAFSWLRISGLTSSATPEEIADALEILEGMCYEFDSRSICTNYNYEDYPDANTESGIANQFFLAAAYSLGSRLASDKGKQLTMDQLKIAAASLSNWAARTAKVNQIQAPRRMPRGSGNNFRQPNIGRFSSPSPNAPISCATININRGAIQSFTYSIVDYIGDDKTLSSYTYKVTNGLTVLSESMDDSIWSYTVECADNAVNFQEIQLTVNTTDGEIQIFTLNFSANGVLISV